MSRKNTAVAGNGPGLIPDDECPVCHRVRYLNSDMEFLYNPECYHPMCSVCVADIYKSGPAQCPYQGCFKTLRQRNFRSAFFKDLAVEREVDIRKRVAAIFNKTEDDFVDLRAYNDYLDKVENLTFDLVSGGEAERKKAEEQLVAWEQEHKAEIERNKKRSKETEVLRLKRERAEAEAARQRRLEEQREEAEVEEERRRIRDEVMNGLANGDVGDADKIARKIIREKRAKLAQLEGRDLMADTLGVSGLSIRGLKEKKVVVVKDEGPYDPYMGLDLKPSRYILRDHYENSWLDMARKNDDHRTPGYSVDEYVSRSMFEAFAGLGVFAEEEKQGAVETLNASVAAERGSTTGTKMEIDDVFA